VGIKQELLGDGKSRVTRGMTMKVRFFPAGITMARGRSPVAARTTFDAG
jgi:hypothetical protein